MRHSLHRSFADAKQFYVLFSTLVVCAAGIVLIPRAPLGLITTAVQALAGILLPSATVFLLLLCNDKEVLGPWVNRLWLNVLASLVVSVLVALSLILMATTVFPNLDVTSLALGLGASIVVAFLGAGTWALLPGPRAKRRDASQLAAAAERATKVRRETWRMPQLALLERPVWSRGRAVSMRVLSLYLVVAVVLLVVKAVQLGIGH